MLGSVIPSSLFLIEGVLQQIAWHRARVIVEYGPGVGTFTLEILRRMGRDSRLVAIETNPEFVAHLRESCPDPRLHVAHDSAAEVGPVLAPDGAFLIYQSSARVLPDLQRVFRYVQRDFEPLNILPARLFFCARGAT
jgi:trans-aconitate methyltransferase